MTHYICTGGCRGVSSSPGNCDEESCPKHGQPLQECSCTDGKHNGAFEDADESPESES